MALINCPECNTKVSDKATNCPQCGFPLIKSEIINQTNPSNKEKLDNNPSKYSTIFISFIGVILYVVLSVLLCNLLRSPFIEPETAVQNEIFICSIICAIISVIIAKSNIDRLIYLVAIALIAAICIGNVIALGLGVAFIIFATNIAIIIVAAYKRKYPTKLPIRFEKIFFYVFIIPFSLNLLGFETGSILGCFGMIMESEFLLSILFLFAATIFGVLNWLMLSWYTKKIFANIVLRKKILRISLICIIASGVLFAILGFIFFIIMP